MAVRKFGEVSEWPKEHAWKVCIRKRIEGSNPSLTAKFKKPRNAGLFLWAGERGRDRRWLNWLCNNFLTVLLVVWVFVCVNVVRVPSFIFA